MNELSNDRRDFLRLAAALPATAAGSWAMAQAPAVTPAAVASGDIAPQDRVFITTNEDSNQHRRPAIARHWRRRRAGDAALRGNFLESRQLLDQIGLKQHKTVPGSP